MWFHLYVNDFGSQWKLVALPIALTSANVFLIAVGCWNLWGRKLNPHQSFDDRTLQIKTQLGSYLYLSMALSVFYIWAAADQITDLDSLDASLVSIYFQAIAILSIGYMLRTIRLEDVNFDVYKDETAVT